MTLGSVFLIALLQAGAQAPRYETLENGLRVVVVEDHALPLVSVQLWYGVGSACDPPGRAGLCGVARTFLERKDDAALRLGGAGLAIGGETYQDACSFSTVLPPNFLEYVLSVESQRMRRAEVTSDALSRALDAAAIISESAITGVESTGVRYVQREFFAGGPYEHTAGFVAASLADVSPTDVDEFLQTWFTPRNATLFVIGDVSTPIVIDLVRREFGEIPGGAAPQPQPRQRAIVNETTFVPADLGGKTVAVAFLTPSLGMYENAAIDVLLQRLLNERNEELRAELSEIANPLEGHAWYGAKRWRNAGILLCFASFGEPRDAANGDRRAPDWREIAERVRGLYVNELSRAAGEIPSPVEHNRWRSQAVLAERPRWMGFGSCAILLAEYEMVAGDLLLADFAVPRLRTVTVPDVQTAATMLLESRCVVIYPAVGGGDSEGAAAPELPKQLERTSRYYHVNDVSLQNLARLVADAPQAATPQRRPNIAETEIAPFVRLRVCRFPDAHWTSVATQLTTKPASGTLSWYADYEATSDDVRRFESYAAYHGFHAVRGVSRDEDRSPAGWWTSGDPAAVPAMLEWHAKLLRARFDTDVTRRPYVTIAAVGAVDADELIELTKENWADWLPAADASAQSRGASTATESGENETRKPGPTVAIDWTECEVGEEWVMFSVDTEPKLASPPTKPVAHSLLLLCGAAPESIASVAGGSADFCFRTSDGFVSAAQPPCDPDYTATVLGVAHRLKQVREGRVEHSALIAATRIARVRELLKLDSTTAVMSAALHGEIDPWLLGDPPNQEQLRRRVVEAARASRLDVRIWVSDGPSAEARDDLQRQANAILESSEP